MSSLWAFTLPRPASKKIEKISQLTSAESTIKLPAGFTATVIAEDIGAARHIAINKNGDIYVKLSKLKEEKVIYQLKIPIKTAK